MPILMGVGMLVIGFLLLQSFGVFDAPVGRRIPDIGRSHIQQGQTYDGYSSRPATSGPHWPAPARWGAYSARLPDEQLVHNLEHGGIVIAYNGIPEEDVERLGALRSRYPRGRWPEPKIVVHPYDRIPPSTIAVAAWGWLDRCMGLARHDAGLR